MSNGLLAISLRLFVGLMSFAMAGSVFNEDSNSCLLDDPPAINKVNQ